MVLISNFLTSAMDINEPIRHSMEMRFIINLFLIWNIFMLFEKLIFYENAKQNAL